MIPAAFVYSANPARIVFGDGRATELAAEIDRLACERVMIIASPAQADWAARLKAQLGSKAAGVFTKAAMHTPVDVTDVALTQLREDRCDGLVSVGGGSAIGLGKALALRTDLPQVVIPTTYAGSEVTPILGQTEEGRKTTLRSDKVLPETVIYDVSLTLTLSVKMSTASGLNALAHSVEAIYARDANPVVSLMAVESIRALAQALPAIVADPAGVAARTTAQYGAWLAGACLGSVGMALHHKICHVLGGTFDLPHAETHAVMLPHVCRYNEMAAPEAMVRIASALNATGASTGLFDLAVRLGAPTALRELGMPESGINKAIDHVMQDQYWNPRAPDRASLRDMLAAAWRGDR